MRKESEVQKSYFQKLKDPRWQKKRLEALEAADWTCQCCFDSEATLHVHHRAYFKGREPWDYEVGQLEVLCESCHEEHHEEDDKLKLVCSFAPIDGPNSRDGVASLVAGFCGIPMKQECITDPHLYLVGALSMELSGWRRGALTCDELEMLMQKLDDNRDEVLSLIRGYLGTTVTKGFDA